MDVMIPMAWLRLKPGYFPYSAGLQQLLRVCNAMACSMTLVSVDMIVRTKEDQKVALSFMALTGSSRVLFQG